MGNFTFNNELVDNSQSAHSSFKRFVILVVMMLMTASSVFANDVLEDIDGLTYRLNLKTKTATLCNRYYNTPVRDKIAISCM